MGTDEESDVGVFQAVMHQPVREPLLELLHAPMAIGVSEKIRF